MNGLPQGEQRQAKRAKTLKLPCAEVRIYVRNQQVAGSSPASSSSVGDPSARLRKSSRSKSGCFFFGCAPGLLLLPMQPAPLGLHGVPFCPGFI